MHYRDATAEVHKFIFTPKEYHTCYQIEAYRKRLRRLLNYMNFSTKIATMAGERPTFVVSIHRDQAMKFWQTIQLFSELSAWNVTGGYMIQKETPGTEAREAMIKDRRARFHVVQ